MLPLHAFFRPTILLEVMLRVCLLAVVVFTNVGKLGRVEIHPQVWLFSFVSVLPEIPSIFGVCHVPLGLKLSFGNAAFESSGRMLMLCHVGNSLMITVLPAHCFLCPVLFWAGSHIFLL